MKDIELYTIGIIQYSWINLRKWKINSLKVDRFNMSQNNLEFSNYTNPTLKVIEQKRNLVLNIHI